MDYKSKNVGGLGGKTTLTLVNLLTTKYCSWQKLTMYIHSVCICCTTLNSNQQGMTNDVRTLELVLCLEMLQI